MSVPLDSFSAPFTISRAAPSSYVNGRLVDGVRTNTTINAVVQPADFKTVQILPEGKRTRRAYNIWAEYDMNLNNSAVLQESDRITIEGRVCELLFLKHWTQLIPHDHAVAVALEDDAQ